MWSLLNAAGSTYGTTTAWDKLTDGTSLTAASTPRPTPGTARRLPAAGTPGRLRAEAAIEHDLPALVADQQAGRRVAG
jgi:hypothetical protein